jgi:hypothetical protein
MESPEDIRRTQARRFAYLKFLYDDWSNVPSGQTQATPVGNVYAALRLTEQEGDRVHAYLEQAGLVENISSGPLIAITRLGIDTVEDALATPDQKTSYFPPINILHIDAVTNSQIQQGTTRSAQSGRWPGVSGDELRKLTHELRTAFAAESLSHEHRQDVDAHVQTLDAQTRASTPNHTIVRESLSSLRSIAEKVGATLIAGKLAQLLEDASLF